MKTVPKSQQGQLTLYHLSDLDPTYTGLNRSSLETLPVDPEIDKNTINMSTGKIPNIRLGGRPARFTPQASFRDIHGIGRSRFDDKGSVLLANIDAVLNLTGHIGGYIANATEDNNTSFYSLLLEDHTLEMHSYIQWRRPLSVSRVIMSRVITKPHLKTAQLDTVLKTDVPAIVTLKPCDGYQIVGLITYGGGDTLSGSLSITLKNLVSVVLLSLTVLHREAGKGFAVFPFSPAERVSGSITSESILDLALLCTLLYKKTWCFRPYLCHDMLCIAFAEPREDPSADSLDEQKLLALWDAVGLLPPPIENPTLVSTVDPEIAKLAELSEDEKEQPGKKGRVKLEGSRNFSRIFDGSDVSILFPKLSRRITEILTTSENPALSRDRVEVLARWQLPDTIETTIYPF